MLRVPRSGVTSRIGERNSFPLDIFYNTEVISRPMPALSPTVYVGQRIAEARARAKPNKKELAARAAKTNYLGNPFRWCWPKTGITQFELAQRSGMGRSGSGDICRIEKGKHLPRLDKLLAMAEALGVPVESLLPV